MIGGPSIYGGGSAFNAWLGGSGGTGSFATLVQAVTMQYQSDALGVLFGQAPRNPSGGFSLLGATIAAEIQNAGLTELYGNLISAPLGESELAGATLYGFGGQGVLGIAGRLGSGGLIDLLG